MLNDTVKEPSLFFNHQIKALIVAILLAVAMQSITRFDVKFDVKFADTHLDGGNKGGLLPQARNSGECYAVAILHCGCNKAAQRSAISNNIHQQLIGCNFGEAWEPNSPV